MLDSKGERMMFRSRNHNKAARKRAKMNNRDWWKKPKAGRDPPITIINVHWTPGSKLMKRYQEVCKRNGLEIKFVEQSGYSLQNLLEKGNPFGDGRCDRGNCFPCASGKRGNCDKAGVGYEILCCDPECRRQGVNYQGETGRSAFSRGLEHLQGLRNRRPDNVLWKHVASVHGGDINQEFEMNVLNTYGRDNTTRLTNEAMRIREALGILLNSKAEYRQPRVPRVTIESGANVN